MNYLLHDESLSVKPVKQSRSIKLQNPEVELVQRTYSQDSLFKKVFRTKQVIKHFKIKCLHFFLTPLFILVIFMIIIELDTKLRFMFIYYCK